MALTYGSIGKKRLVIETENLGEIVEIWMLNSKRPKGVIHSVIEVCYGNLDSPIVLIVSLHMPHITFSFQIQTCSNFWGKSNMCACDR